MNGAITVSFIFIFSSNIEVRNRGKKTPQDAGELRTEIRRTSAPARNPALLFSASLN